MSAQKVRLAMCALLLAGASGCLERELVELNPCLIQQVEAAIATDGISRVDLLFVIDNSDSMEAEQALLRQQFPRMIDLLTSGKRPNGETFEPIKDLHVGVISTDLGAPGGYAKCTPPGDDGKLLTRVSDDPELHCSPLQLNQPFLSYQEGADPVMLSTTFQCMASLGINGCGFEQQLESTLKSLAPDPARVALPVPEILFYDETFRLVPGHGAGANAGFLRGLDGSEDSILAVVLVTDEEDCSARDLAFFGRNRTTEELSRINLLCNDAANEGLLYPVERYVQGLRALRPNHPERVIFAAIVGLPDHLKDARESVDFENEAARNQYYDQLLGALHTSTFEDPSLNGALNVSPICDNGEFGTANPAPRIVQVAKGFGENGIVHSICTRDFRPALDAVVDKIADNLPDVCLTFPLVPDATGRVDACAVQWELPLMPGPGELASCAERPFLHAPDEPTEQRTNEGRQVCIVDQVAVQAGQLMPGQGWYYDDFSDDTMRNCSGGRPGRIAFTNPPGPNVNVSLSCARETPAGANLSDDKNAPHIGSACASPNGQANDALCVVPLLNGATDTRMRCHPEKNVCVLPCTSDIECPAAWVCDQRQTELTAATGPVCVNPTCGE